MCENQRVPLSFASYVFGNLICQLPAKNGFCMELANETESFKCATHTSFLAIPWKNSFKVQKWCSLFLDYPRSASYIHKYPLLLVMT